MKLSNEECKGKCARVISAADKVTILLSIHSIFNSTILISFSDHCSWTDWSRNFSRKIKHRVLAGTRSELLLSPKVTESYSLKRLFSRLKYQVTSKMPRNGPRIKFNLFADYRIIRIRNSYLPLRRFFHYPVSLICLCILQHGDCI